MNYPTVEKLKKALGKKRVSKLSEITVDSDVITLVAASGLVHVPCGTRECLAGHENYQYGGGQSTIAELHQKFKYFCDGLVWEYGLEGGK